MSKTYAINFRTVSTGHAQIIANSQPEARKVLSGVLSDIFTSTTYIHADNVEAVIDTTKITDMKVKRDLSKQVFPVGGQNEK